MHIYFCFLSVMPSMSKNQACKLKYQLREGSFPAPLLPRLSALRAAWLGLMQQKQEMSSLNQNIYTPAKNGGHSRAYQLVSPSIALKGG